MSYRPSVPAAHERTLSTSLILADVMQQAGIRAFIGKLSMDKSSRPSYVEASATASISAAKDFIEQCRHQVSHLPHERRLVEPVLTPRFVPTCSDELLVGLGKLSETHQARIQSHLAEAHDQIEWVKKERGADDLVIFKRVSTSVTLHVFLRVLIVNILRANF